MSLVSLPSCRLVTKIAHLSAWVVLARWDYLGKIHRGKTTHERGIDLPPVQMNNG